MNFGDLIGSELSSTAFNKLAEVLETTPGVARTVARQVAPAFLSGLQSQIRSPNGLMNLGKALERGDHQRYLRNPEILSDPDTTVDGNKILGHLFGSKDVSRKVAEQTAQQAGVESRAVKKSLPVIAGLIMGVLSKQSGSGSTLSVDREAESSQLMNILMSDRGDDGIGQIVSHALRLIR